MAGDGYKGQRSNKKLGGCDSGSLQQRQRATIVTSSDDTPDL
jgi:hypothetical protein